MKTSRLLIVIAMCLAGSGCRLAHNAWLTTIAEPIHYPRNLDDKLSHKRFSEMGEVALDEAIASARANLDDYVCEPYSTDHQRGFIDGFVDYLEAGGTGMPPVLPPRKYWRGKYQTPVGQQCVQDWFEGYDHGVAVAQASNYRSYVVVPTSDVVYAESKQGIYGRLLGAEESNIDEIEPERERIVTSPDRPRRLDAPAELSRLQPLSGAK